MALTKTRTTIHSGASLVAGAGPTNSSWYDVSDAYQMTVMTKTTNGTGVTTGPKVRVEGCGTNGASPTFDVTPTFEAPPGNAVSKSWVLELPQGLNYVRLVAIHPVGGNATIDAELIEITGL